MKVNTEGRSLSLFFLSFILLVLAFNYLILIFIYDVRAQFQSSAYAYSMFPVLFVQATCIFPSCILDTLIKYEVKSTF